MPYLGDDPNDVDSFEKGEERGRIHNKQSSTGSILVFVGRRMIARPSRPHPLVLETSSSTASFRVDNRFLRFKRSFTFWIIFFVRTKRGQPVVVDSWIDLMFLIIPHHSRTLKVRVLGHPLIARKRTDQMSRCQSEWNSESFARPTGNAWRTSGHVNSRCFQRREISSTHPVTSQRNTLT